MHHTLRLLCALLLATGVSVAQPVITSVSPTSALVGTAGFTMTINGTGFSALNRVLWDSVTLSSTFVSTTQLQATVTASELANAGTVALRVRTSVFGSTFSNTINFPVNNPVPALTTIAPNSAVVGTSLTLTLNGSSFVAGSVARINGVALATSFVSSTQLTATVPAAEVATTGSRTITVFNPTPGGGTSVGRTLSVQNPVPVLGQVSPNSAVVGSPSVPITVTGSSFVPGSSVRVDGTAATTTFVSATQLTAIVPAASMFSSGARAIAVLNPAPGGGLSNTLPFTVNNPVPTVSSASPTVFPLNGATTTMTVTGANFVADSVVHWNGSPLASNLLAPTTLQATVPSTLLTSPGARTVTVVTAAPGGGTSAGFTVNVENPAPVLTTSSPSSAPLNGGSVVVTVNGSGFVSGASIKWNGVPAGTTAFLSSSQVRTTIPSGLLAGTAAFAASITVDNPAPSAGPSNAISFQVTNPFPQLLAVSPTTIFAGSPPVTLTVTGQNFVATSFVSANSVGLPTTFVSPTTLTATLSGGFIANAQNLDIRVGTPAPGGGTTNPLTVSVVNPLPVLNSLSPNQSLVNSSGVTLTLNGSDFVPSSVVFWQGGTLLSSTFLSTTQMEAFVPPSLLTQTGIFIVTVVSPNPGGGTSAALNFSVVNPAPAVTLLNPASAARGSPSFQMIIAGSGFVPNSIVRFGGGTLTSTFQGNGLLFATVDSALLAQTGTVTVSVENPLPGGGISSLPFDVLPGVPVVNAVNPNSALVGSPQAAIQVTGAEFAPTSVVTLDGTPIPTSFASSTTLNAVVPGTLLATAQFRALSVVTPAPGGGVAGSLNFSVANPPPTLASLAPSLLVTSANPAVIQLSGSGFLASSTVQANGIGLNTTFVDANTLTAVVSALLLSTPQTLLVEVSNPAPGGGISLSLSVQIQQPTPAVTAVSPNPFETSQFQVLAVTGSGFAPGAVVSLDGQNLPTTVVSSTAVQASVPSVTFNTPATHALVVTNTGLGATTSAPFAVNSINPAPVISGISPLQVNGGPGSFTATLSGAGFCAQSLALVDGFPAPTIFLNESGLLVTVAETFRASTRAITLQVFNPAPGGGLSSIAVIQVNGPTITAVTPNALPVQVPGNPPVTIDVLGSNFTPSCTVRANGFGLFTTFVSANLLQAEIDATQPYGLARGGVSLCVTNNNLVTSNAKDLYFGSPQVLNRGTITLPPAPPTPGASFSIRVEAPAENVPVTLIADLTQPAPVLLNIVPGLDVAVGVIFGTPLSLGDGLGILGPADGTILRDGILPLNGPGLFYGTYEVPLLVAPAPALGLTVTLQAVYLDLASPIGIGLTHPHPVTL